MKAVTVTHSHRYCEEGGGGWGWGIGRRPMTLSSQLHSSAPATDLMQVVCSPDFGIT